MLFSARYDGKAEVARLMKQSGEPAEKIIVFTGLTKEGIECL
jgi:hypothetical protein